MAERVREEGLADADGSDDRDMCMRLEEAQRRELLQQRLVIGDAGRGIPVHAEDRAARARQAVCGGARPEARLAGRSLKGEDYKVAVEFTRTDGQKTNVQGDVMMFGPLGQRFSRGEPRICHVNEVDVSAKCVSKLVLSEDMDVLLRVALNNDAGSRFALTVAPHKEP